MSLPILYSFRRCPYAMRARMAMDAAQIHVEHREVVLRDKPEPMLQASPKGTVPVLVIGDHVIDESLDIMIWALSQNDPDDWLRHQDRDRPAVETFLSDFKERLDRYKYASRYDGTVARGDVDLNERRQAMTILSEWTAPLAHSAYVGGDTPSLADIASVPFVRQFAAVEPEWWTETASAGRQKWLSGFLKSERFTRIMTKHPVWKPASPTG